MQPIDPSDLTRVTGGAGGAILGGLLKAAPGIMQGVTGIIGAAKSGGGGGGRGGGGGGGAPAAAPSVDPGAGGGTSAGGGGDPTVSVSVSINGVRQA